MLGKFLPTWVAEAAVIALAALALAVPFWLTYEHGSTVATVRAEAKAAQLAEDHATAMARAQAAAWETERALTARAQLAEAALAQQRAAHAREATHLKQEITRVTTQYRTALDAALSDRPGDVFTVGFVRLYNAALGAGGDRALPEAGLAGGAAAPPAPAEALDSGVRQRDILGHIVEYGQRCRGLEAQLNALIDVIEVQR